MRYYIVFLNRKYDVVKISYYDQYLYSRTGVDNIMLRYPKDSEVSFLDLFKDLVVNPFKFIKHSDKEIKNIALEIIKKNIKRFRLSFNWFDEDYKYTSNSIEFELFRK